MHSSTRNSQLKSFVHQLDLALIKMHLPPYYDQPRFHTSLLWSTTTSATCASPNSPTAVSTPSTSEQVTTTTNDVHNSDDPDTSTTADTFSKAPFPFSDATVAALEAQLGRALREDEFYVAEVCVKIGKEVKRFPLAG